MLHTFPASFVNGVLPSPMAFEPPNAVRTPALHVVIWKRVAAATLSHARTPQAKRSIAHVAWLAASRLVLRDPSAVACRMMQVSHSLHWFGVPSCKPNVTPGTARSAGFRSV